MYIYVLIIFLFFFSSCKKKENKITISGTIYEEVSNQRISGAKVKLSGTGIVLGVYSSVFVDIETVLSDAGGNFSFSLEKEPTDIYKITVTKQQYFTEKQEISSSVFATTNHYSRDIKIKPEGYIKIHLYNSYPFDDNDTIIYYFTNTHGIECFDCCTNATHIGLGPYYDTIFNCKFYGNQHIFFIRTVIKNKVSNTYIDSLYCQPFDTVFYAFPY